MDIDLKDLCGWHSLDAVDFNNEGDGNICFFRMDGVVYAAIEDEEDSYRSSLQRITVCPDGWFMHNVFPYVNVLVREVDTEGELIEMLNMEGKPILTIGTERMDAYYPVCIMRFEPENLPYNNKNV